LDRHRNDIDGLRAIAVLSVLFYHGGVWPFASGFVGVDIFFVISGYLITGLVLRDKAHAISTLVNFYDRRIRRILPALLVVLAASSVVAFIVLLPDELVNFGRYLVYSVLFGSNIYYWRNAQDYFGPAAGDNPLLHIWSLSVEEQFYLLWPVILVALFRGRWRGRLPFVVAVLAGVSLLAAVFVSRHDPVAAFFLLPTRAWELLAGAFLATAKLPPPGSAVTRDAMAGGGLVLIALGLVWWPSNDLFPAWNAVCATFGTALALHAGESGKSRVGAFLGSAMPVFVGKISYSLYLWHWPLLVFARLIASRDLHFYERILLLVLAVVLAALSWAYVEQPVRRKKFRLGRWPASFAAGLAVSLTLFAVGGTFWITRGLPSRVPPLVNALEADAGVIMAKRPCQSARTDAAGLADPSCVFGTSPGNAEAVVWGDSFADAATPGLVQCAAGHGLRLRELALASCPPLPGAVILDQRGIPLRKCQPRNAAVIRYLLADKNTRLVILHAVWEDYITPPRLSLEQGVRPCPEVGRQTLTRSFKALVGTLTKHGIKVLIIGSVPRMQLVPLHCLGRFMLLNVTVPNCGAVDAATARARAAYTDAMIRDVAGRDPNVRAYFPMSVLCARGVCPAVVEGHLLYRDSQHLSGPGARLLGRGVAAFAKDWDVGGVRQKSDIAN
jgi:peptidoglycan/LPS O-acetylase OafA/YrhL